MRALWMRMISPFGAHSRQPSRAERLDALGLSYTRRRCLASENAVEEGKSSLSIGEPRAAAKPSPRAPRTPAKTTLSMLSAGAFGRPCRRFAGLVAPAHCCPSCFAELLNVDRAFQSPQRTSCCALEEGL